MMKPYKNVLVLASAIAAWAGHHLIPSGFVSGSAEMSFKKKHIAPILFISCAECHRPGESAPFSVLTYKDARPWAQSIREKVVDCSMPPWLDDSHVGAWANDRRLSQKEVDTIAAWVELGAEEGDAKDLPPAPQLA